MSDLHYVGCSECCYEMPLEEASIEAQIVSKGEGKDKIVAVRRYLICPMCFHEYTLFYTDRTVMDLLEQGENELANERCQLLWEYFENGS